MSSKSLCLRRDARISTARIFTAAPGLVKLIQGGSWADTNLPDPFAITEERMRLVNSGELSAKPVRLL